jgi:hypothetical protein
MQVGNLPKGFAVLISEPCSPEVDREVLIRAAGEYGVDISRERMKELSVMIESRCCHGDKKSMGTDRPTPD